MSKPSGGDFGGAPSAQADPVHDSSGLRNWSWNNEVCFSNQLVPKPATTPKSSATANNAAAKGRPRKLTLNRNPDGLISGDVTRKAITGPHGICVTKSAKITPIVPQAQRGVSAAKAMALGMARRSCLATKRRLALGSTYTCTITAAIVPNASKSHWAWSVWVTVNTISWMYWNTGTLPFQNRSRRLPPACLHSINFPVRSQTI